MNRTGRTPRSLEFKYILDGHTTVVCPDLDTWATWTEASFRNGLRKVADDTVDGIRVSTVFLGVDHNHSDDGPPLLFETCVFFREKHNSQVIARYSTWDEAVAGHNQQLENIKARQ